MNTHIPAEHISRISYSLTRPQSETKQMTSDDIDDRYFFRLQAAE